MLVQNLKYWEKIMLPFVQLLLYALEIWLSSMSVSDGFFPPYFQLYFITLYSF